MSRNVVIEDIYPLTPLQQGMLFHTVRDPNTGVYIEQFTARLAGLDIERFREAWQTVLATHAVLRSAFIWEEASRPLQAVLADVALPFEVVDGDVSALLAAEVACGFSLDRPPLMRLALTGLGDGSYQFVWTFHHLLLDGWSVALVLDDVDRAYAGWKLRAPRPFRDYVSWLAGRDTARDLRFWREELDGFTAATPLPFGARPNAPERHETFRTAVPAQLASALGEVARARRITVGSIVQCAWALMLARHSGQDDVVFGVTVSGRPADLPGVESMVGLFINTLPARIRVDPHARVGEWLEAQHRRLARLHDVEQSALPEIQRCAPAPLFHSLVLLPNASSREDPRRADNRALVWEDAGFAHERTNFPLTVSYAPGARLTFNHDTAAIDSASVRRLAGQFVAVLEGLAGDPGCRVGSVSLLGGAERERLLAGVNATGVEYGDDPCLHELFEAQADRVPGAVAVECGGQRVTYAELDQRANWFARYLAGRGVGPETVVGVCLERSVELIVALLGVLKAGGCYLPVDPALPAGRREFMLADAGAALLVDRVDDVAGPAGRPGRAAASNAAYVIYTSGSTGRPKGVVAEHRGLVNLLRSEHGPGRVAQLTSVGFDVSLQEIFGAIATGGTLVVFSRAEQRDLPALPALIEARGINVVHLTPTVLHALDGPVKAGRVVAAGEELITTGALLARLGEARLVNHYGPTETHVALTHAAGRGAGPVPIGRPIANARAYVLDAFLEPVPAGVTGELYLGGPGVARGYLGRPGLTAERFVPDPFGRGRLYRTGDLVRFRDGDVLEFVGRRDRQVKIRGHRIEPGEIEAALGESVVLVRDGRLVAYVREPVDIQRLRTVLPPYMVPSAFVTVGQWPRTVNGKINREALPAPTAVTAVFVPPRTPVERKLAAIWADILGVERIGLADDFFALGGDSISAMSLIARARRECGVAIDIGGWLEHPTLEAFATGQGQPVSRLARGTTNAPPLVLVHPGAGSALAYAGLARSLGALDVYGVEAPYDLPEFSVESLAAHYLPCLPDGPLHLGGWSFGGLVAFELAHRLGASRVGTVLLIDTWHPDEVARLGLGKPRPGATGMLELSRAAMASYRPPGYEGRVVLIKAQDEPRSLLAARALGWGAGVELTCTPGTHDDLLSEARAAEVASVINRILAKGGSVR